MSEQAFSYADTKKECVRCALCGVDKPIVLASKARGGTEVCTRLCSLCGLIYISPRMTKSEYDRYYKYFYRTDRGQEKRKEEDPLIKNFEEARRFGVTLGQSMREHVLPGRMIDVGSSTGGVLVGFKEVEPALEIFGVEPSAEESAFAREQGVPTENCLFEDFKDKGMSQKPQTIVCVQSLNHLLNPDIFIDWAFQQLGPDGRLILAVKNFRQQVRRAGRIENAVQIDHPYMFTPETLRALVESRGFEVVYIDIDEHKKRLYISENKKRGLSTQHIRLVARKREVLTEARATSRLRYWRHRIQFFALYVRLYYLFVYSRYLISFRRALGC